MAPAAACATTLFLAAACWSHVSAESLFLSRRSNNTVPLGTSVALSEEGYQQVASLKSDEQMNEFVLRVLHKDGLEGNASYLQGLVPWYSGTRAIQSLARLREELIEKPWVHRITQASFISKNSAVDGPIVSGDMSANVSKQVSSVATATPTQSKVIKNESSKLDAKKAFSKAEYKGNQTSSRPCSAQCYMGHRAKDSWKENICHHLFCYGCPECDAKQPVKELIHSNGNEFRDEDSYVKAKDKENETPSRACLAKCHTGKRAHVFWKEQKCRHQYCAGCPECDAKQPVQEFPTMSKFAKNASDELHAEKAHIQVQDKGMGTFPAARQAQRYIMQHANSFGIEERNHEHRLGRPERDALLTGREALPSKIRQGQRHAVDPVNRLGKSERSEKRGQGHRGGGRPQRASGPHAGPDEHPHNYKFLRITGGGLKNYQASHAFTVDKAVDRAGTHTSDDTNSVARGMTHVMQATDPAKTALSSHAKIHNVSAVTRRGDDSHENGSVERETTMPIVANPDLLHQLVKTTKAAEAKAPEPSVEPEKPIEAANHTKTALSSNAKINNVSARMPRGKDTHENGPHERNKTMELMANQNVLQQAVTSATAAEAKAPESSLEAVKPIEAANHTKTALSSNAKINNVSAGMLRGSDTHENGPLERNKTMEHMANPDVLQQAVTTAKAGEATEPKSSFEADLKVISKAENISDTELSVGSSQVPHSSKISRQVNSVETQPSVDGKMAIAAVVDNTFTLREPDEAMQATVHQVGSNLLPEVPSLLDKSKHVLDALNKHVNALKHQLTEAESESREAVARKRYEYERKLEQQIENSTSMAKANEQLGVEIQELREQNVELRNRAMQLKAKGAKLHSHMLDLKANLTLAQEYVEGVLESRYNDSALLVLRQLDEQDAALLKSRAHAAALQQVATVLLQTSSKTASADPLELVGNLREKFDDLEREKAASMTALKQQFEEHFNKELQHQDGLKEEGQTLKADRDGQLALRESLHAAVDHLEQAVAALEQQIKGLQAYAERVSST